MDIDLSRVTIREWRGLFKPEQPQEDEDAIVAKIAGITVDELLDLSQPEYRRMLKDIFEAAREPLADPN